MSMNGHRMARALGVLAIVAGALPAAAAGQGPPALPGPPPGNGLDLPSAPGTAPPVVPAGTAASLPGASGGPGLLGNTTIAFNRSARSFSVPMACTASGTVSVTGAGVGRFGRAGYRCAGNRARARFTVTPKMARRVARARTFPVTATVRQAGRATKLWFALRAGGGAAPDPGFWTDGHLQCTQGGAPLAFLAEPDFTTATPTVISTRGWVATYTAAAGWHWYGVGGENAARWETWNAARTGVVQFHPAGAVMPVPWTWGPIAVPAGQALSMVGVYEIVYWVGGRPEYQWRYVNAGTTGAVAAGAPTPACFYP